MALPYENATTGKAAMQEIQKILQGFGVQSFGHMEDYDHGEIIVQFKHRDRTIVLKVSARGWAKLWLRKNPHTSRHKKTLAQYERAALDQGYIAVHSVLRDWIKAQVTAVECGMLKFESAFLGQIMLPSGETVYEKVASSQLLRIEDGTK